MSHSKTYKISDLKEYPGNYNKHPQAQIEQLKQSLVDFFQYKNVVIWQGYVITGYSLIMAARELGWEEIEAKDYSYLPEDEAKRLLSIDNEETNFILRLLLDGLTDPTEAA